MHTFSPAGLAAWRDRLAHAWPDVRPAENQDGWVTDALLVGLAWALVSLPFLLGRSFIPWDSPDEFFPQARFVASTILHGQAPWWNPFLHSGQPVLGDPQGMIFTPQVLVGLVAGTHFNLYLFDVTSLGMELCGGIALARYTRAYSDTRTLPILGALVFIAGGVATSRLQHVPQIASYSLLPLQLLGLRAVCLRPTVLRTTLLTLTSIAAVLNPNQVVFLSFMALLPFAALHICQSSHRVGAIAALAIAGITVLLVDLPVLSAIDEFVALSNRATMDIGESLGSSFPAFNMASIFLPGLYGVLSPANGIWAPTDISQDFLYIGLIPATVLLSSLLCLHRKSALTLLCWGSLLVWFAFSMGMNTPLYPFLFHHAPGFSAFRRPADGAYLLNLFLAILIGSSRKFDPARLCPWPIRAIVIIVEGLALGIALARLLWYAEHVGHLPDLLVVLRAFGERVAIMVVIALLIIRMDRRAVRWAAAPLVIGLTIADLAVAGRAGPVFSSESQGSDLAQVYSGTLSWDTPRNGLEQSIATLQQNAVAGENPAYRMEALGGSLGASMPMAFGILTTQGYDVLTFRSYNRTIGAQYLQNETKLFTRRSPNYDSPDYRRLGLRFVLIQGYIAAHSSAFGAFGAAIEKIRAGFLASDWARKLPDVGAYEIWELGNALPRAMLVVPDGSEHPCDLVLFETTSLSVRCRASVPGRLVLGEIYAPGWLACVNGNAAPVERYQSIFRSVAVPEGDSQISFHYQPIPMLRTAYCQTP